MKTAFLSGFSMSFSRTFVIGSILILAALPSVAMDNAKVEACVQKIREAPADVGLKIPTQVNGISLDELLQSIPNTSSLSEQEAEEIWKRYESYTYDLIMVGDKSFSNEITQCINEANVSAGSGNPIMYIILDDSYSNRRTDWDKFEEVLKANPDIRYLYSDSYMRKYVLDVAKKKDYTLVRIPRAGSIESLGFWEGTFKDPIGGCKNSYGDPCGTRY